MTSTSESRAEDLVSPPLEDAFLPGVERIASDVHLGLR